MDGDFGSPRHRRAAYWSGGIVSGEQGTIIKDWGGRLAVGLVYPNSYYLGMSNLGLQVIYGLLNSRRDTLCERIFWEGGGKPTSLENDHPPADFAVLAFTFSYELDYLNLAPLLRASGLSMFARERGEDSPILVAGGPCIIANPTPLAPFFDVLAVGEAEALLPAMLPVLASGASRSGRLERLAALPGLYVPACHAGSVIERRFAPNLSDPPAHSVVLTQGTELGALYLLEVERGCSWNCRFCLVSHAFCPTRFYPLASLLAQAREGLNYRGRLGLVGPVVSDHPQVEGLLEGLLELGAGFSLSSLRLKPLRPRLLELVRRGGAESLAIAPEAGSERLRRLIRKGFSEDDILAAVEAAAAGGFRRLKLYFMAGLPGETDEDIAAIVSLALRCQSAAGRSGPRLSLNVAPFVPKAGTPFQWLGMAALPVLARRLALLQQGLRRSGLEVKAESPAWSQVQGALSRGDEKVALALSYVEQPSLAGWKRATKEAGLDLAHYVNEDWDAGAPLPWDNIRAGFTREELAQELARSLRPGS